MSNKPIDPRLLALCAKVTNKRPKTAIAHIIKHGYVTTEDLQELGYDHPPRVAGDVRDEGIPLETFKVVSTRTGRKIAAYRFGDPADIKAGRIGGRTAFSKAFKAALVERYGEFDTLTSQPVAARYLQIDHRVPYQVVGDAEHDENNLDAYMLLDASNQRAKSWSCEHCENWRNIHDADICRSCYWASPEGYSHVAMREVRRVDVQWDGEEVAAYAALAAEASGEGVTVSTLIKRKLQR